MTDTTPTADAVLRKALQRLVDEGSSIGRTSWGGSVSGMALIEARAALATPAPQPDVRVDDLAMLVRRLVHQIRKTSPANDLAARAVDYLRRKGLLGSILREEAPQPDALDARTVETKALALAVRRLFPFEPDNSRFVSDEFVALASVVSGVINADVEAVIDRALATAPQHKDAAGVVADAIDRGARALINISPTISGYHETHLELMRPKVRAVLAAVGIAPAAQGDAEPVAWSYEYRGHATGQWKHEVVLRREDCNGGTEQRNITPLGPIAAPRPASDDARDVGRLEAVCTNNWRVVRHTDEDGNSYTDYAEWRVLDRLSIAGEGETFRDAIDAATACQAAGGAK